MNTVEPIRDDNKILEILEDLEQDDTWHGQRMYLLMMTGIYTGLRISDILRLRVGHVRGDAIITREKKTGKIATTPIHPKLRTVFDVRLSDMDNQDYLFPSRRLNPDGTTHPISRQDAEYDCKCIKDRYNLKFPFNCHSLRKTFGYNYYKCNGGDLEGLRQIFNHSTQDVTRRYIGIDIEERQKRINKMNIGRYDPPKPDEPIRRKKVESEVLQIDRLDRTANGIKYGEAAKERARKHREQKLKKTGA